MLLRVLILAIAAALCETAAAPASVQVTGRDEPLAGARLLLEETQVALPPRSAPFRFDLVGLHWQGPGTVWFRTRSTGGVWSEWHEASPESEDRPDPGTGEARRRSAWRVGNPWWTGSSSAIQYRLEGRVERLRAYFVSSPPRRERQLATASAPAVVSRAGWGADESIVRAPPSYAPRLELAIVHHTAGANDYGPDESAAIIRAIQAYHVKANGWNDIGYNLLVDRYGQVFEGRAGGIDRNVVGAHAAGFNAVSTGVAVLGSYGDEDVTEQAEAALASVLAWRLDVAHVDPSSTPIVSSGGNGRFPRGTPVQLRAISGHRDTGDTACPGTRLYDRLPVLAETAAGIGMPKLYEPRAAPATLAADSSGGIQPIVFTARSSAPLSWSVTVLDEETGSAVASGSGYGESVLWTWDPGAGGAPVDLEGHYVATLAAEGARPATIRLWNPSPPAPALGLSELRAEPAVLTPNGDGDGDTVAISFELAAAASVRIRLLDETGGRVATILRERSFPAGAARVVWDGSTTEGTTLSDGRYRLAVRARQGTTTAVSSAPVVIDRTLGGLRLSRTAISPNGDGRKDTVEIGFELVRPADVRVLVRRPGRTVATLAAVPLAAGSHRLGWDGQAGSSRVADGSYTVVVEARTTLGLRRLRSALRVDSARPELTIRRVLANGSVPRIRLWLSERVRLRVWTDAGANTVEREAGEQLVSVPAGATRVRLVAWDAAGNASRPVRLSLRP